MLGYLEKIASIKFRNLPPSLSPTDVVQETFVKLLKNLDKFHYRADLRTWCTTILFRTGIDLLRQEKRRREQETISIDSSVGSADEMSMHERIPSKSQDPETILDIKKVGLLIDVALQKCKNKAQVQQIFEKKMAGLDSKQISRELHISVQTVDMTMHRLKKKIIDIAVLNKERVPE